LGSKIGGRMFIIDLCISNRQYLCHPISSGHAASWQSSRTGETAAACS
jgi:hypothetical protein